MANLILDRKLQAETQSIIDQVTSLKNQLQDEDLCQRPLSQAIQWLQDVTQPLTEDEMDRWEAVGCNYCQEMAGDMDSNDYSEAMTDADRRAVIEQLG